MLEIEKARGFSLPDGANLEVEAFNTYQEDGHIWKSLDISLVGCTGYRNLLCSIDYEDGEGLRVLAYEKNRDMPVFEKYIGYGSEASDGDESEDIPLFLKDETMKIELSQAQALLLLEALDALSENADNENAATDDKDIHKSNDEKISAVANLYAYIANHPMEVKEKRKFRPEIVFEEDGRHITVNSPATGTSDTFELVDCVPPGYEIWNIGENMADGYLPLCRLKTVQEFEGGRSIEPDTLKAIKCEGAQLILAAIHSGEDTVNSMERYLERHRADEEGTWGFEMVQKIKKALPYMRQIKGLEG